MDPREKPKDPNDPRGYLPVRNGAGRLVTFASVIVAMTAMVYSLWTHATTFEANGIANGIMCAVLSGVIVRFALKEVAPELRAYWRRNVRGYRLACWIGSDSSSDHRELRHVVIAPGNVLKSEGVSACTLVLPLGGWFCRSAMIVAPEKEGYPWLWGSVQLHLRYPLRSLDNIGDRSIQITDRHGDRLTVTVQRALEFFEQHGVNALAGALDGWRSAFDLAYERSQRFGVELAHECEARRITLGVIKEAILRIKASSRFGASIEALRIRIFLLERFRGLVPTPRPEEPQSREWCMWAEKELEAARADLARREHHKKSRPSTGAGV